MAMAVRTELSAGRSQLGWTHCGDLYIRGYVWRGDALLSPEDLARQVSALAAPADLSDWLNSLNGCFALVWEGKDWGFAAVDIGRTIPLFWRQDVDGPRLKDQLQAQAHSPWLAMDWPARAEFVPGSATYHPDWRQLRAGEYLCWGEGRQVELARYFSHQRPAPFSEDEEALRERFARIIERQTSKLVEWADGRPIAIPLSGGYDSRFLLAALQRANYPAIQAFTYGRPDSWEVRIAWKTAERLGVDWQFVHYTPELMRGFFTETWASYADYAANAVSVPQEQDFFALRHLREQGWLKEGTVICPGYTGDFQAGSYLPGPYFRLPGQATRRALARDLRYRFVRRPDRAVAELFRAYEPSRPIGDMEELTSALEEWVLTEYVSKFILNGLRAYEWWELAWYLPQWDRDFITFWQRVPPALREGMHLYRRTLEEELFQPLGIFFPEYDQAVSGHRWADWLPRPLRLRLKRLRPAKPEENINGLHWLAPAIQRHLGWEREDPGRSVNEMIGWWCLSRWRAGR